jgi:hypothetical protein
MKKSILKIYIQVIKMQSYIGTIGFESFRTEMIIDEIRTAPSEDIVLER